MHLRYRQAVETVLDAGATIGESPAWSADQRALFWIDIKKPALYRLDPQSGSQRCWLVTSDIGGFGLMADGVGAVVALRAGLFKLDFGSGALEQLAAAPYDQSLFRFNEAACDAAGRLWIGVMCDPVDGKSRREEAPLHSFTLANGLVEASDRSALHNGMGWRPDGKEFYLSHSYRQEILAFAYDPETVRLGEKRVFANLPQHLGIPDGAAVDSEGGYWCACHGGGRLRRFNADGTVDRDLMLPVSQPTMCAFGGEKLDELYITSARDKLTAEGLEKEPLAGAILRVRPGIRGMSRPCTVR
jgi:sugar lactone lactonase YvrE